MTWMKHAEHGGIADLPDLPYWAAQGWEPTDERPSEPDLYCDPPPPANGAEEFTEAPDDPESPGPSAAQTKKPAAAAKPKKETGRE